MLNGEDSMADDIRILVSDDDMSIRSVVTSVLTDEGYQVTAAENGEHALEFFRKHRIHWSFPLL
jgi:CheY-like chemotaxis protein